MKIEEWEELESELTLKIMREYFKLPKLTEEFMKCVRCAFEFKTQKVGKKRVRFYCNDCHNYFSEC